MTKVSVFGQQHTEIKELKKIEFVKYVDLDGSSGAATNPSQWQNVMLVQRGLGLDYDSFIAWDVDSGTKHIYLGHWNDGVV